MPINAFHMTDAAGRISGFPARLRVTGAFATSVFPSTAAAASE
jgi:hypothetical protein